METMNNREIRRGAIRFREITAKSDSEVTVGRNGERVVAFEFRNEGTNSFARISKAGAGYTLNVGEEKSYALDGNFYFLEQFIITFTEDKPAIPTTHKVLLTEIYDKSE